MHVSGKYSVPPAHPRGVTRRQIFRLAGGAMLATSIAGCDLLSTSPSGEDGRSGKSTKDGGKEAPMLADRVKSGDLPPVQKRLPTEPLVIEPTESAGRYGGTWHSWIRGASARYQPHLETGYDYLVRWDPDYDEPIPNLATWEIHHEGREYVFHLRAGTKWSDGKPFTADDIMFAYQDILLNTELYPIPPKVFTMGDAAASLEKVDRHTVRFSFEQPSGMFLYWLCTPPGGGHLIAPRHYLEQYHKKYNDQANSLASDEGYSSWTELLLAKNDNLINLELPVLNAWRVTAPLVEGGRLELERNPYYWKTDPDGRQLPYMDKVVYPSINNVDTVVLKAATGEIDFQHPRANPSVLVPENKPVLAQSRQSGRYRFVDGLSSSNNQLVINLNLTHKDPALRRLFNDREFRIALSHAIDRGELIDAVYHRQGEPWQAAPGPRSSYYSEELAKQFTEFNLQKANEILDEAGYAEREGDGFRVLADSGGRRISFQIDVSSDQPSQIDALQLIKGTWAKVGVEVRVKTVSRSLFQERKVANAPDANVWGGAGGLNAELLDPRYYFPYSTESNFAVPWATWYESGGQEGEKPPEEARLQMELYEQVRATVDRGERQELFTRLLDITKEQFWCIGAVLPSGIYGTVKDTFHNTPQKVRAAWMLAPPGPTRPEQYWTES